MQICTGLNSLIPCNNESKSSRKLCYGKFSFIVLVPSVKLYVRNCFTVTCATGLLFMCIKNKYENF